MTTLPIEYRKALIAKTEAWNEYQQMIDRPHTSAEFEKALGYAESCEAQVKEWYTRWQAVGGTSDIESIEAAELEQEQHKALQIVLDVTAPKLPPAKITTMQQFAEARERRFNQFYYGNQGGLPYFPHQTQEANKSE